MKTITVTLALIMIMISAHFSTAETPCAAVKVTAVEEKTLTENIIAYGAIEPDPDQVLSLSLPHAGFINRVWVRAGQRVKCGDKLLEVITAPEARMQYLQAQSTVDFAKRELSRQERLLAEQLATKSQVDEARKNLHDAQTTLESLRRQGIEKTEETLRAPMDGIITRTDVNQGERIQANTTAMLIAAETRLIARLGVEPEDVDKLSPDNPVTIVPVFIPGVQVKSSIREVHAMIDPTTHLVEVLAPIPESQGNHLVLGSRVLSRISIASRPGLVVPRSAVLRDDTGAYVFRLSNGTAKRVNVRTGMEESSWVEIAGEIKAGDPVVIQGNYELSDGMAIREITP
jgi:RND family efflux transporter MFP subunit